MAPHSIQVENPFHSSLILVPLKVYYKPVCNYFIANIMDPLKDVVFDPNAHNVTNGNQRERETSRPQ